MTYLQAFEYGSFAIFAIAFPCYVLRCRMRVRAQAIWAMILLACSAKFFIYHHLGGHAFAPNMPEYVIWIWNWGCAGACLLAVLGVVTLPLRLRSRVWLLPLVAWSIAALGVYNGVKLPDVREVTLEYEDLPAELEGYRIVHLTDIHISAAARRWRTRAVVDMANRLNGDLIAVTGDIVDGRAEERVGDVAPLKDLHARDGVWFVTGNHEGYSRFWQWAPYYERWNIRFLHNECVFPRKSLAICGMDDGKVASERHFAAATNGEFRVLLEHRPRSARIVAAGQDVRLQLSGHTHGGVMPVMRWIVASFNGGFDRGVYDIGTHSRRAYLSVSAGAGQWAGFPVRFFNPSEILVYKLVKRGGVVR